jgi:hypothetical protein
MRRRLPLVLLSLFLAYTGAYIFIYMWRAFQVEEPPGGPVIASLFHGDNFARTILVAVLFQIGLTILIFLVLTRRGMGGGQIRLRQDLWEWLSRESEETGETPNRLVERAVASYRTRMEGARERVRAP